MIDIDCIVLFIELAYEVYKQNENVLLSNKTLSDSYSGFDTVSDYDGDTLLFVNSGQFPK
ncbi:hypothetical protein DERF_009061 [Dermatophagoides farinae]|uniref:Uncharacterized protein n=1 Tax=Dermatophagoides farinae TaxID=6954 RepID=A0A922HW44_DERFA|nr:hypothetical protein DERF_009061 [Dermatophagoides farinae]